ncbi:MAG: endolytic transglycosylase MltG [Oscillospiraceae bacterium]|nr:endolytic transglycosylase MltG [Oscillospiraceae bacterium]
MPKKNSFWKEFHDDILNVETENSGSADVSSDIWEEYSKTRHPNVGSFVDLDSVPGTNGERDVTEQSAFADADAPDAAYAEDDSAVEAALTRRERRMAEKRAAKAARRARHADVAEESAYEDAPEDESAPILPGGIDLPTFDEIMEEHKRQIAMENEAPADAADATRFVPEAGAFEEVPLAPAPGLDRAIPAEDAGENAGDYDYESDEEDMEYAGDEDGYDGDSEAAEEAGPKFAEKLKKREKKNKKAEESDEEDLDEDFRPVVRHKARTTGIVGGLLYFIFVLCVSAALAAILWLAASDVLALGRSPGEAEVTIPDKATAEEMADALFDADLIRYKKLFVFYAGMSHAEDKVSGGTYVLDGSYDYRALVNGMTSTGGTRVEVSVTVPEGYTLAQIIELLEENKVCSSDELWDAAANYNFEEFDFLPTDDIGDKYRLEGYLFPDTYKFYVNDTASRVLGKFLSNFESKWPEEYTERASNRGLTMKQIITVASMIEKEAGSDSERATISSVIFNRLNNPGAKTAGYLQIDACLYYAASRTGQEVSTSMDDPYNTYMYKGLTPGPISNPGAASIKAALWPEDTNYFYYGLSTEGTHKFFRSYDSFVNFLNSSEYIGNAE